MADARRVLVIRLGALGDIVQSFAPFAAIRAHHPAADITLLTTAPFAAWLGAAPWFDRLAVDARPRWWQVRALARLAATLRGFDLVYDLQTSGRSTRYFWLAGCPAWSGIGLFRRHPHRDPARNLLHTRERQRGQLRDAGIADVPVPDRAALAWAVAPVHLPSPRAVLVPGASEERGEKCWPVQHYAALAAVLAGQGLHVVVAGGPGEQALGATIAAAAPGTIDLTGHTTLAQLGGVLDQAALVVGNDSGPMHLAALLAEHCVVLFGPASDPALTAPRRADGTAVTVLRAADLAGLSVQRVAAAAGWGLRKAGLSPGATLMPAITLPDGSVRTFDAAVTGATIAAAIGPGLAKAALAMKVDGQLRDLSWLITDNASVRFVTRRDPEALDLIRHDTAHVLAEAVQALYPGTEVTIGPAIENGFYYDFARNQPFTPEDFPAIEAKMREIIAANAPFTREVHDRDEAIAFFEASGERYKAELIRDLPPDQVITFYRQGDWVDLCRGPHMRGTADIGGAFKLMKVAGAYWRGDHRNAMLSRIYGTAWRDGKELEAHLHQLAEAERRDHRRIGKDMDLFHIQEEAVGSIFWHPKGWRLYRTAEAYMRRRQDAAGYSEVRTPQLVDRALWEQSGHWDKYREHMFVAAVEDEDKTLALKPMNCPCHVQIFRHGSRSYRDLPMRMAEFGACHRYEPSGALHGIMRVRAFTQDDAHIFCTEAQVAPETAKFVALLADVYRDFGFDGFRVKFADRPPMRAGLEADWDRAEAALREACALAGVEYELNPGEGAFYGPKLEFVLRDAIGRDWQCGTLQVDYILPERLDASYTGEDGARHRPVMLHRAILGSFERFLGILIEQYAGRFPLWLAPTQLVVATIVSDADDYAHQVAAAFGAAGLQVEVDAGRDKINAKIRLHSVAHVPVMAVVGRREAEQRTVALRRLGGDAQEVVSLDEAVRRLALEARPPDLRYSARSDADVQRSTSNLLDPQAPQPLDA